MRSGERAAKHLLYQIEANDEQDIFDHLAVAELDELDDPVADGMADIAALDRQPVEDRSAVP